MNTDLSKNEDLASSNEVINAEETQQVINANAEKAEIAVKSSVLDAMLNCEENSLTEEEKDRRKTIDTLQAECRVSIETPYPKAQSIYAVDGVSFFDKGDIHAIKAKQKSGKTHVVVILAAVALGAKWSRVTCEYLNPKVLVIDTEQKAPDTQEIYRKVLHLAELPEEDRFDRLQVYTLRKKTPQERGEAVKLLIEEFKPDVVFIDGVVDLSCDFNEVSDSQTLIQMLMTLSTENDCAIVNILHTNKAQEDHNMRGHLGTMLGQKSGNVLECVKTENKFITVRSADSRHAPVPEWSFAFDDDGNVLCADDKVELEAIERARSKAEKEAIKKKETENQRVEICKAIMSKTLGFVSLAKFKEMYQEEAGVGRTTARTHVNGLIQAKRLIEEDGVIRLATFDETNRD